MDNKIPKIQFAKNESHHIEVMDFEQLYRNLNRAKHHNPFTAHKIEFHLILIVTQNAYVHFVDFQSYDLQEGSAVFVAKNQVHHFTKS